MNTLAQTDQNRLQRIREERPFETPEVNIYETADGYSLEAEMPGVPKDGLEITLEGNQLSIIGRKNNPESAGNVLYREIKNADYRRVFELDPAVDTGKIAAKIEQGLLKLHLPKAEKVKPRKIDIS